MKLIKLFLASLILLLTVSVNTLFAVPAYPGLVNMEQPDGSSVTLRQKGDELASWYETADGYTVLRNSQGYLAYAMLDDNKNMIASSVVVGNEASRTKATSSFLQTTPKKLTYSMKQLEKFVEQRKDESAAQAPIFLGDISTLCILVGFPDKPFTKSKAEFENMMSQPGYNVDRSQGSVKEFFHENSYGKMNMNVTVIGPVTVSKNTSYYGGNVGDSKDVNVRELAKEVALLIADSVDFAVFDNDNDGVVDVFHMIFAGRGEEAGGGEDCIWSHKWNFEQPSPGIDGKTFNVYSCSPEMLYTQISTIGVVCHELSHVFGMPDYYDVNGTTDGEFEGTGDWDLMASGSWNGAFGDGSCPAHINMYEKIRMGWVASTELIENQSVSMPSSVDSAAAYIINTSTTGEYFILENKQKTGFDSYLPGEGLLIYRVHKDIALGNVNATHPQKLYPVCASSTYALPTNTNISYGTISGPGCAFPGTSNKTSFGDATTPSMKAWDGSNTDKLIDNIQNNTATKRVSFTFTNYNLGGGISNDTTLSNLTVSSGVLTPNFSFDVKEYSVNVDSDVDSIEIGAAATDAAATVSGIGWKEVVSGINNFSVVVTAEDGVSKGAYRIAVNKAISNNAFLCDLDFSEGVMTPSFSSSIYEYWVRVPNNVDSITAIAAPCQSGATISGDLAKRLDVGVTEMNIEVTAEDEVTKLQYTIWVERASQSLGTDATLRSLSVSTGTLSPAFSPDSTNYKVRVEHDVETITIDAQVNDANAHIEGVGDKQLSIGVNYFRIVVTAEDSATQEVYEVLVEREKLALSSLSVSIGALEPEFNADTLEYTLRLPERIKAMTIFATTSVVGAEITGVGRYSLGVGNQFLRIRVSSKGESNRYTIYVVRDENVDVGEETSTKKEQLLPLNVYPNPTTGLVYVENEKAREIRVYNLSGDLMLQTHQSTIDISGYPSGIYIVRVENRVARIIKQ